MQYLTTHDLVWINTTITGAAEPYNYVTLEAAMAGQYSYGESKDAKVQAAELFSCLIFKAPFATGNIRTLLIATLSFLNANGYKIQVSDEEATGIVQAVVSKEKTPSDAISALCAPATVPEHTTLRTLIALECNAHQEALTLLAVND